MREFDTGSVDGSRFVTGVDLGTDAFERYVKYRLSVDRSRAFLPPGWVHCTYRWIVDDTWVDSGDVLGFLAVRQRLTPFLFDKGGHIGYSVRPSR